MAAQRAARLAEAGTPAIAAAHFQAEARPYHPVRDPDGYLNLGTAENRLLWDLLEPKLTAPRKMTAADTRYAPLHGTAEFREAIGAFLARTHGEIDPEDLIVVAGASAALDIAASALCDPGEGIVVPAPYYSGFDVDLTRRSEAVILSAPGDPHSFAPDPEELSRAVETASRSGVRTRALALASPANPVGTVLNADELAALASFAGSHDLDVISDEIYANSVIGPAPFLPFATAARTADAGFTPSRVHTIWGFAKDFALPGFKVGVLHTSDPQVRAAARELAYFAPVPTDTQHTLTALLADGAWVEDFLGQAHARLRRSYEQAAAALDDIGVQFIPAQAGFSIWMDLGPWLAAATFGAEAELHRRLLEQAHLNILPGEVFHSTRPGWFRMCHAADPSLVATALDRLGEVLTPRRPLPSPTRADG